jgi:hypothetical protein
MAGEDFIPVVGDDWYQRRREDAEGRFFRSIADQAGSRGVGGSTRQGIYAFTADGRLLAARNAQDPDSIRELLNLAWRRWRSLPARDRTPGAFEIEALREPDPRFTRTLPAGGLALTTYTRILDNDARGQLCRGSCSTKGGDRSARDHLWLTAEDLRSLIPARGAAGDRIDVPATLVDRLLRYHLLDNTRGEPSAWGEPGRASEAGPGDHRGDHRHPRPAPADRRRPAGDRGRPTQCGPRLRGPPPGPG